MIERVYLLLEIVTYLLIANDLYDRKLKLDFPTVVTIAVEVILFRLVRGGMSDWYLIIPYILVFFYCIFEFHSSIQKSAVNMLLASMFLGIIQLVAGCLSFFIKNQDICALIVNMVVFIFVLLLVENKMFFRMISYMNNNSKMLLHIILCYGVLLFSIFLCYSSFRKLTLLEYFLIVIMYVLLISLIYLWKKEHETLNYKIKELDTFHKYHLQEKKLYSDVRKKQHEFKNQLSALYSTHYTCATYEELVSAQKKYADWIMKDNQYNDLLLSCKPLVLAGFIYSQLENAKEQGIQVEYSVSVMDIEDVDREYDYICVFGILFDNAMEAVKGYLSSKRKIEFDLVFDDLNTEIRVENVSDYITNDTIERWFEESFSTKDGDRGYGLSNVINIRNKYNADIVVKNINRQEENWISIRFKID